MRKKTINELLKQLNRVQSSYSNERKNHRVLFVSTAFDNAFYQHFKVNTHTKECKEFVSKYGRDFAM